MRSTTMSYCLNPSCENPSNPENANQDFCQSCACDLLLNKRYRGIKKLGEGGCAFTYEVCEVDDNGRDNGTRKVLKILHKKDPKRIELFAREARLLKRLRHRGIPRFKDYFIEEAGIYTLHCLVMEKIEGMDLEKWFKDRGNQPITQEQAIYWLSQLTGIIDTLHQNHCIHRDIKPSNIMLKNDGQLVLIDFGAVREINNTNPAITDNTNQAITDEKEQTKTQVGTRNYMPDEQNYGEAFLESDFYALGRTFLELLTGKLKSELDKNIDRYTGKLEWPQFAPQVSKSLADLIDDLIAPFAVQRPKNTKELRKRLIKVKWEIWLDSILPFTRNNWLFVVAKSTIATTFIVGIRLTGILQSWELAVFDEMMRSRPSEPIDPRILVVEVTQEDLDGKYPIEDGKLAKMLEKIAQSKPLAIGLDMHRYQPRPPGREELIKQFQQHKNLFTVCSSDDPSPNFAPPDEFSPEQLKYQVGFSDLELDADNSVRRQLLTYNPENSKSPNCITSYSLSFLLFHRFLNQAGKPLTVTANKEWKADKIIFKKLSARAGGYQDLEGINPIFINYRANAKPAQKVRLAQVLAGKIEQKLIQNRIVLIGYTASVARDEFKTPWGEMPGVWIHAHMTSQLVSAVTDGRPLLWVLPQWGDAIVVWVVACLGGMAVGLLCWRVDNLIMAGGLVVIISGIAIASLYVTCVIILSYGGWMPFIPSVLSLLATGGIAFYTTSKD